MAGLVRRAMVYLGLVDDDYDDYEPYEEQPHQAPAGPAPRQPMRTAYAPEPDPGVSSIRTLPREPALPQPEPLYGGSGVGTVRPQVVRPIQPVQTAKVHVLAPTQFQDAQEIGDRLKANQPVIVNLQGADRDLSRRMVDFCSGATYALGGAMDKVARDVFLLTPSNVEVSPEEKRRLQERGYRS
ncbi:MAG TPA: cell division protein SepF [Acidimicrobiales bacterium]|nr:cell division protein SepF [Acidimicrobiales bacterium]